MKNINGYENKFARYLNPMFKEFIFDLFGVVNEKDRYCVQIKWYNTNDEIIGFMNNRLCCDFGDSSME